MATTTIAAKIARASVGLVIAGLVIGTGGTAFADTPTTVALAGYTHVTPASGENQDRDDDSTASGPDAEASTAGELTVTGSATGAITADTVSCTPLGNGYYSWQLLGTLDDAPIDITFNTAAFHGADAYKATGITDDQGGLATLETGDVQVVSNGANLGTFTIDEGAQTGSIDTDLSNNGQAVHVAGTWTCS
jgi:hypothetical protein